MASGISLPPTKILTTGGHGGTPGKSLALGFPCVVSPRVLRVPQSKDFRCESSQPRTPTITDKPNLSW
jgi:hypothetical protein